MTFVLLETTISKLYALFNTFTIKKLIFYVFDEFVLLISEMIIIKIADKKIKKKKLI